MDYDYAILQIKDLDQMILRSVASWVKQEQQEIAIPNIPASKPSTRQKTTTRKGKPSAFAKAGIH